MLGYEREAINRCVEWIKNKISYPYEIELRPTNRCNLKCLSCYDTIKNWDATNELSFDIYKKIIKEAHDLNVKRIHICGGGEPLMRKDILEIMSSIKKFGMEGRLITNGTLFNEEMIKKIVIEKWDTIFLSIDAPDAETHDYLRGVEGTFEKVIYNVKRIQQLKKRNGSETPRIVFAPLLTKEIYKKLCQMVELAKMFDVKDICLQLMISKTKKCEELMLDKNCRVNSFICDAKKLADHYGIRTNFMDFVDKKFVETANKKNEILENKKKIKDSIISSPCFFPWFYMNIYPDGTVQPCADAPEDEKHENIKHKNLKDIWFGDYFTEYRKRLTGGNLFPWCKKCCGNKIFENLGMKKQIENIIGKN